MKSKRFITLFASLIIFFGLIFLYVQSHKKDHEEKHDFFVEVPIVKFSRFKAPCVNVLVENQTILMQLDLGFNGNLLVSSKNLELFKDKSLKETANMWGFEGKKNSYNQYLIPKIEIGDLVFKQLLLREVPAGNKNDGILIADEKKIPGKEEGRTLGWELFYYSNLLLNCKDKKIAFCDGIDTLKKHGYPVDKFTKASLCIDRGLLEFPVLTDRGSFSLVLDTGCTWNLWNGQIEEGIALKAWIKADKSHFQVSSLKIAQKEFGPQPFLLLPIKLPFSVDAILGMEFLEKNIVFIDFQHREVYFLPADQLEVLAVRAK